MQLIDEAIFATDAVRVGRFRCSLDHPCFRDAGPIRTPVVVFPRTCVWIQHAGAPPFVADPTVATIYNRNQEYIRAPLHPSGDRADWFGVAPDVALAVAKTFDPTADERPERPFRGQFTPTDPMLYYRQRELFLRVQSGVFDSLSVEEEVLEIVAAVMRRVSPSSPSLRQSRRVFDAHRDLASAAKAELAVAVTSPTDVTTLARRLAVSPFHLCRVFRRQTGTTLHQYRLDLRVRLGLEGLGRPDVGLSRLALELGFSSHSHFTAAFRRRLRSTPDAIRRALTGT